MPMYRVTITGDVVEIEAADQDEALETVLMQADIDVEEIEDDEEDDEDELENEDEDDEESD